MTQQELPYTTGANQWIADIRALNIKSMPAKFLLQAIHDHIPPGRGYWDMKPDELARECAMHRSTYYRAIRLLSDGGFVSVEEGAWSERKRYRIIRSAVSEAADVCRQDAGHELCAPEPTQSLASEPVAESDSQPVAESDSVVAESDSAVAESDSSITHKQSKNSPKQRAGEFASLPVELDVTPFRDAWEEWLAYRRSKRKPVTLRAAQMQLTKLAAWGVPRAVAAIEHSITQDYQGIYEPSDGTPQHIRANGRVHGNWIVDDVEYIDL